MASSSTQQYSYVYPAVQMIRDTKSNSHKISPINEQVANDINSKTGSKSKLPKETFPIFEVEQDPSDNLYWYKILLRLMTSDGEPTPDDAFTVWLNMYIYSFDKSAGDIKNALSKSGYEVVEDVQVKDWLVDKEDAFPSVDIEDISDLDMLTSKHVAALMGIECIFMGRLLTTQNENTWLSRRMSAFASAVGADDSNPSYEKLMPSLPMASGSYKAVSTHRSIRRLVFKEVYQKGSSNSSLPEDKAYATALVFLAGTEMAMFGLINKYILEQNPILLAWNELHKHTDNLFAAYKKWQKFGDLAPYCKLLYEAKETEEFNRHKLKVFANIAVEIAIQDGIDSLTNYKGKSSDTSYANIIDQALKLVKLWGGARTHGTNAVDNSLLLANDNKDLRDALHKGAGIIAPIPSDPNSTTGNVFKPVEAINP